MIDEGYVKYHADWRRGPAPKEIDELVAVRNQLRGLGLIGIYQPSQIGYGNISIRRGLGFVISGSATGGVCEATAEHFCSVEDWNVHENSVVCSGPVTASSESLTHAMLYACDPAIGAVVHVHHLQFWEHLLSNAPASAPGVAYGTPEMALEMAHLMAETALPQRRILAMTGHPEGVISIGPTLAAATATLLSEFEKWEELWGNDKKGGGGTFFPGE